LGGLLAVVPAGDRKYEHAELYAMKCTRPFAMTQLPAGDGRADEWQRKVFHKRCLAATEAPLVATTGSEGAREEVTMGFAFRFGLFRKSPNIEKHVFLFVACARACACAWLTE
jgi:hypothetical protein